MAKGDSTKTFIGDSGDPAKLEVAVIELGFTATDQYKTGGFTINPSDVGFTVIYAIIATGSAGYHAQFVAPNKLLLFRQTAATSALVEIPDNTNISAVSPIRLLVFGANI